MKNTKKLNKLELMLKLPLTMLQLPLNLPPLNPLLLNLPPLNPLLLHLLLED
jgi:hypothetical protein